MRCESRDEQRRLGDGRWPVAVVTRLDVCEQCACISLQRAVNPLLDLFINNDTSTTNSNNNVSHCEVPDHNASHESRWPGLAVSAASPVAAAAEEEEGDDEEEDEPPAPASRVGRVAAVALFRQGIHLVVSRTQSLREVVTVDPDRLECIVSRCFYSFGTDGRCT